MQGFVLIDTATADPSWSKSETDVFERLKTHGSFDARTNNEKSAPFVPTADRPVTLSGAFLSEIIRRRTDHFPIGVQIHGVAVKGDVDIENVHIDKLVSLQQSYVDGRIIARNSRFIGLDLSGSVVCDVFDLRGSVISGGAFLRWGFTSQTSVLMRDTTVTGPVDCTGAIFRYDSLSRIGDYAEDAKGESFSFARSSASSLLWQNLRKRPQGIVSLRNCRLGELRDAIDTAASVARDWPLPGRLRLRGLKYDARSSENPEALLAWINLQDADESRFGTYQTNIKLLTDQGNELSANTIILAKQRYITRHDRSYLTKLLRYAYIWLSDAGLNTDKIAIIFVLTFLACFGAIDYAERSGQFVPKDIGKEKCSQPAETSPDCAGWILYRDIRISPYSQAFSSLDYTIDLYVPGVNIGVAADWHPKSKFWTRIIALIRLLGIGLTGLLVFSISGIARFSR